MATQERQSSEEEAEFVVSEGEEIFTDENENEEMNSKNDNSEEEEEKEEEEKEVEVEEEEKEESEEAISEEDSALQNEKKKKKSPPECIKMTPNIGKEVCVNRKSWKSNSGIRILKIHELDILNFTEDQKKEYNNHEEMQYVISKDVAEIANMVNYRSIIRDEKYIPYKRQFGIDGSKCIGLPLDKTIEFIENYKEADKLIHQKSILEELKTGNLKEWTPELKENIKNKKKKYKPRQSKNPEKGKHMKKRIAESNSHLPSSKEIFKGSTKFISSLWDSYSEEDQAKLLSSMQKYIRKPFEK